jgi:hypothetical protein
MAAGHEDDQVHSYFFIEACPLAGDDGSGCSHASWKNASVWGWTPEECQNQLKIHLMRSGHHHLNEEDANTEVCLAEIKELTKKTPPNITSIIIIIIVLTHH